MSACEAELCPHWTGQGCICDVMDLDKPTRCTCPCIHCSNQAHWMCHGEGVEIDTQQNPA